MKLVGVMSPDVPDVWPTVEPMLRQCDRWSNGEHTAETIRARIKARDSQLWVVVDCDEVVGVMVTRLDVFDTGMRAVHIVAAAGRGIDRILETQPILEDWARAHGASKITLCGRPGWARRLRDGWQRTKVCMEVGI